MLLKRKRYVIISTFIILAIVAVILCVALLNRNKIDQYDGTLVHIPEVITNIAEG